MTATVAEPQLSERDFRRLSDLIYRLAGIHLVATKKIMIELRLRKRLQALQLHSFAAYCDFLFEAGGEAELPCMIDLVTTNKTDFFREPAHFEYLTNVALPALEAGFDRPLAVWSAGCSSGQEPYTLAMVLSEYSEQQEPGYRFAILATDISGRMLERARLGIYEMETIAPIPMAVRRKYLLKSREPRITVGAGGSGDPAAGGVPASQPDGLRLSAGQPAGCHLLPQRGDLFRQADSGTAHDAVCPKPAPWWLPLHGAFGNPARPRCAPDCRGAHGVSQTAFLRIAAFPVPLKSRRRPIKESRRQPIN